MSMNLIMGIGNLLMTDDGVGVHAARAIAANPPPFTRVVDAGTDIFSALPFLEATRRAIIIDALQSGKKPGCVRIFKEAELSLRADSATVHAVTILLARRLLTPDAPAAEIVVIGVEPDVLEYGMDLSPRIFAALPHVDRLCRRTVEHWNRNRTESTRGGHTA